MGKPCHGLRGGGACLEVPLLALKQDTGIGFLSGVMMPLQRNSGVGLQRWLPSARNKMSNSSVAVLNVA